MLSFGDEAESSNKITYARLRRQLRESDLHDLLEEVLQYKVELVPRKFLSPHIGPHILREVEPILE